MNKEDIKVWCALRWCAEIYRRFRKNLINAYRVMKNLKQDQQSGRSTKIGGAVGKRKQKQKRKVMRRRKRRKKVTMMRKTRRMKREKRTKRKAKKTRKVIITKWMKRRSQQKIKSDLTA